MDAIEENGEPPCGRFAAAPGGINGTMGRQAIRILGIDPGLRRTGWGLIEADGNRLIYVACGSVETSDSDCSAIGWC